ncbi:diguanylate cyclase [Aquipseudomonas alcaligenes]|uniref:diguanylate cyclase n=1 Tax=Aquipseudomonas alcaligenes TaxID=43263 RepID=A0A1N6P435_AQUAC|nr:diguanylate cyclase [Pseudomonas alcaligenes]SIP99047.1 response regulator receiver modulated diguanylate cyclase [Pseudomonas alcaligenes]
MDRQKQLADLQAQLQILGEQFALRLKEELPQLAEKACYLQRSSDPSEQLAHLQALRSQLHKLAGSAGTFGFKVLGDQARALEQQAQQWLNSLELQHQGLDTFVADVQQLAGSVELSAVAEVIAPPQDWPRNESPVGDERRIYILEDEDSVGENIRRTLSTFGYQARHFTGTAGLDQALAEQLPDALIVDVNLGDAQQNGLEYVSSLQQRLPQALPVLVLTTQNDFDTQLQAARLGAVGFFSKPVDVAKLEGRLEQCFAQHAGAPYRVLIVDDDHALTNRYRLVLSGANMLVEVVNEPARLFEAIARFSPEVLLLDVNMPGCSGPELAQMVRFNDDWIRIPIIYLSAETDIGLQMSALLKAGDDFVTKPISDKSLVATVFSRAQRARLLSNALARDSLTGLLKHADIKEQVALEYERAQRTGKPMSVVMLDIDHFKKVNDSYGHGVGDNVIRALANLLRQRLRRVDSLGRYGGEEFMAVLPECSGEHALQVLDEIRQQFAQISFSSDVGDFSVSLSAGVASCVTRDAGALIEAADKALYSAKHSGRNQVCLAE